MHVCRPLSRGFSYGTSRVAKVVLAAAVPPYLYKSTDNPNGGLDDDAIAGFQAGVTSDRIAFLDQFTTGFFTAGGTLMVSEAQCEYARDIAAFTSPRATLECITAFRSHRLPRRLSRVSWKLRWRSPA